MKLIKLAVISAVALFLMVLFISLLIPSRVRISRAIDISIPKDSMPAPLRNLQQWQQWNELVNHEGLTNKKVSSHNFSSDQLTVTIQPSTGDTLITRWRQQSGRYLTSGFTWHGNSNRLVLQWYFDVHLRWYPWEKFSSIVFDKQLGPPMEKSLTNLKKLLENSP
jgi:hypothetical protein